MGRARHLFPALLLALGAASSLAQTLAIHAGRLVDVENGIVLQDQVILVEGERIREVGAAAKVQLPPGAREIDLRDWTVLPGLIDAHVHLLQSPSDHGMAVFARSEAGDAIQGVLNARTLLESGFTGARVLGGGNYADVALRQAIDAGKVPGPRLRVAGPYIGITGGCNDPNARLSTQYAVVAPGRADGPWEVRRQVREHAMRGVDLVKTCSTGSVLSMTGALDDSQWSREELEALVDEAHMHGLRVAVHAHGTAGIRKAIEAGVDSVEHASMLDEDTIALARKRGTALVMDIWWSDWIQSEGARNGVSEESLRRDREVATTQREGFRAAHRAGVDLVFGTDGGGFPVGMNARQFASMVEWGMTPMEAIRAATLRAARLLGTGDDTGSLSPGKYADVVAVRRDPVADVRALEQVDFVMKGGEVVKGPR